MPISRKFVTRQYALQHSKIAGFQSIFNKLYSNTGKYIESLTEAWSGNITGYIFLLIFILSLVISVIRVTRKSNRQSTLRVTVYAIMCVILGVSTILLSYFPQMFLGNPILVPRVFVGFGAILSCCCLNVYSYMNSNVFRLSTYRRYILVVPVCAVAYSLILFSYAYSRANWAQKQYEDILISGLRSDTDRLTMNKNITRFAITGSIGRSPLVVTRQENTL